MKHIGILVGIIAVALAGCSSQPSGSGSAPQMTQTISAESQVSPSSSSSPASSTVSIPQPTAGSSEDALEAYAQAKAQEEAYDIDIDLLEASFRVGQLSPEEFQTQKANLKQLENQYELQADQQELLIPIFQPETGWVDASDPQGLFQKLRELEPQEDALEIQLEQLEMEYSSGSISRDEFLQQSASLLKENFLIEQQLDWLEDNLEMLGYDD